MKIWLVIAVGVLLFVVPFGADSQERGKTGRIGFLSPGRASFPEVEGFRQGLRDHDLVEGQNLHVEWRFAEGRNDRLPVFAAELVGLKLDVIVTVGAATTPARQATAIIPIVFMTDALAAGIVPSLARPGGNLTGVITPAIELTAKRLELLRESSGVAGARRSQRPASHRTSLSDVPMTRSFSRSISRWSGG